MREDEKKKGLQQKLSEQRSDYMHKMKVIDEIKQQKQQQDEQEQLMKQAMDQKRANYNKFLTQNFKDQRAIDRLR